MKSAHSFQELARTSIQVLLKAVVGDNRCLQFRLQQDPAQLYVETKTSYCTVSVVDPVVPPEFAPMVEEPAEIQVAFAAKLGAFAIVGGWPRLRSGVHQR
jgi:hypothetical protein